MSPTPCSPSSSATTTGLLLVTAVLQVWRHSLSASIRLLAVQGARAGLLVIVLGVQAGERRAARWSAVLVLALKAVVIPWALIRTARGHRCCPRGGAAGQPHRGTADRAPR